MVLLVQVLAVVAVSVVLPAVVMALLPATEVGIMVLPLMIFHLVQLLFCAVIAKRLGRASSEPEQQRQPSEVAR